MGVLGVALHGGAGRLLHKLAPFSLAQDRQQELTRQQRQVCARSRLSHVVASCSCGLPSPFGSGECRDRLARMSWPHLGRFDAVLACAGVLATMGEIMGRTPVQMVPDTASSGRRAPI